MKNFQQSNRCLKVFSDALGEGQLFIVSLKGHAALNELYEFTLYLVMPRDVPMPTFDKFLGASFAVELTLPLFVPPSPPGAAAAPRYFHGIGASIRRVAADPDFIHLEAVIVPRLWLATQNLQTRVIPRRPLDETLKFLLAPYRGNEFEVRIELRGQHLVPEYSVQFQETDFAYLSRILEDEGIAYYFEFGRDHHTLVISDVPDHHPRLDGHDAVRLDEGAETFRHFNRLTSWVAGQNLGAGKFTQRDYHFEMPTNNLEATKMVRQDVTVGDTSQTLRVNCIADVERYEYPGYVAKKFDAISASAAEQAELQELWPTVQRVVQTRAQELEAQLLFIEGKGTCAGFTPGFAFGFKGIPEYEGDYYLTRVDYHVELENDLLDMKVDRQLICAVGFRCQPIQLPYRPRRVTPRPRVQGLQTAKVVGPSGDELYVDKFGRIRVQFWWDRQGKNDGEQSCWLRVAQVWAGPRWGAFFWPRLGHEVVVAFIDGDPDQPIIVGSVYNAQNMPPLDLTTAKMKMIGGIRSKIFGGNPLHNFNHVEWMDIPNQGQVQIHSEHHSASLNEVTHMDRNFGARFKINGG